MTDRYRLETAPTAPGLATIVDNRTDVSILAVHDRTPVIQSADIAGRLLRFLNRSPIDAGTAVTLDERRGHLVLDLPHRAGHAGASHIGVVGTDMGGGLLNVTASGAYLDADDARELAEALHWWADRQGDRRPAGFEEVIRGA